MPTFNVGQDCQVVITGPFGELDLPNGTQFSCDEVNSMVSVKKLTGSRGARIVFDCWKGKFTFARADATADNFAQQIQDSSLSGSAIPDGSITYQINELDGTQTRWQLTQVTMNPSQLGNYAADASVMQTVDYQAEQRHPA